MNERGQSIILITLSLTMLFALAALAIDGARVYATRRQMQTAADAGALAGAYELCVGKCNRTKKAAAAVERLAWLNYAEGVVVEMDCRHHAVRVTAHDTLTMFFAGMVGIYEVRVEASAAAECDKGEVRLTE